MKTKLCLAVLLLCSFAAAQSTFGNITATGSSCLTTPTACVVLNVPFQASAASIVVSGTFTATLQFEVAGDATNFVNVQAFPLPSGGAVQSTAAAGTWIVPIGGYSTLRVRASAYTSGIALISIQSGMGMPAAVLNVQAFTPAPAQSLSGSPQTPITISATGAASAANAALPGVAGKTTYITGFQVTGGGATAASVIAVTVTGTITGTMNYRIAVPAGVTLGITPLIVSFPVPVPASAVNTAITVNVPSFGAGNTDAATSAQGFQQ